MHLKPTPQHRRFKWVSRFPLVLQLLNDDRQRGRDTNTLRFGGDICRFNGQTCMLPLELAFLHELERGLLVDSRRKIEKSRAVTARRA